MLCTVAGAYEYTAAGHGLSEHKIIHNALERDHNNGTFIKQVEWAVY